MREMLPPFSVDKPALLHYTETGYPDSGKGDAYMKKQISLLLTLCMLLPLPIGCPVAWSFWAG